MPKAAKPAWFTRLMRECPPTKFTEPDWSCEKTLRQYHRYTTVADILGLCLMPWQRLALAIMAMPRCFELVLVVGRQQGKTVVEVIPIVYVLACMPAHTAVYSAQRGVDAERKIKNEFKDLIWNANLNETVGFNFNAGTGDFGIHTIAKTHLRSMSSDKNALRGETRVALGIIDEARSDKDYTRSILMTPTTTVVANAKMVTSSTAGDVNSVYLNETQDKARLRCDDPESTLCLLEYSLDGDEEYDPGDPELWKRQLPAIGYTVTEAAIRRAYEKMEPHDFAMEYLGRRLPMATDEAVPNDVWRAACFPKINLTGELVLAVDAPPEQDRTAAVVCDAHGQVELIDVRSGPVTAYDWLSRILERNKDIATVALANNNTLKRTGERIAQAGHRVAWYDTKKMHMAASRFWEAINSSPSSVAIQYNPVMNAANAGSFRWALGGGGWVFMRQTPEDFASPLIAATLAYDAAVRPGDYGQQSGSLEDIWDQAETGEVTDIWDRVAPNE